MKRFALAVMAVAAALALGACATIERVSSAIAPYANVGANGNVARHCIAAQQAGVPVDQRRQNRVDFLGIAYKMRFETRTTTAEQQGVSDAEALRRRRCPPIAEPGVMPKELPPHPDPLPPPPAPDEGEPSPS